MAWVMHYASALHLTTSRSRFNYVFSNIENGGGGYPCVQGTVLLGGYKFQQ
jgi:hypothetical protein